MCANPSESSSMKHMVMDGDNLFLPEEIITNILKRLPVKSLMRFQCVCKQWKILFKTPSFIEDHLQHSSHQNPFLLFERNDLSSDSFSLLFCLLDRDMQIVGVQNAPLFDSLLDASIIDSSNGLLCVELINFDESHSLLLWNPAIREVRQVPKAVDLFAGEDFYVGFGFSPIVNDYKIVRIQVSVNNGLDNQVNQVEMYSLRTGSWKIVEFGNLDGVAISSNGFTTNGAIFWFAIKLGVEEEDGDDIELIVSFDIAMEVFTLIPIPTSASKSYRNSFTVYENKLALLSCTVTGNFESCMIDLWVLEEGAGSSWERWSWTKKYTSSPYPCLLRPVTIWWNEIVCNVLVLPRPTSVTEREVENDERKIVLFNLTTNKFKIFACLGYGIFNYVESLVPVGNMHIEEP